MDNILIKIEKLKEELKKINEQITLTTASKESLFDELHKNGNSYFQIIRELDRLKDEKNYAENINKNVVLKLIRAFLLLIASILSFCVIPTRGILSGICFGILGFCCWVTSINEIVASKNLIGEKKIYNLDDIDSDIMSKEKELEENKKWKKDNEVKYHNEIETLEAKLNSLFSLRQIKISAIENLKYLRNSVIEEYVDNNIEVEDRINSAYEKVYKKYEKRNSE